jgi:hypothetical protein
MVQAQIETDPNPASQSPTVPMLVPRATQWPDTDRIFLSSVGARISEPTGADKLDYTGFLGIRYETAD